MDIYDNFPYHWDGVKNSQFYKFDSTDGLNVYDQKKMIAQDGEMTIPSVMIDGEYRFVNYKNDGKDYLVVCATEQTWKNFMAAQQMSHITWTSLRSSIQDVIFNLKKMNYAGIYFAFIDSAYILSTEELEEMERNKEIVSPSKYIIAMANGICLTFTKQEDKNDYLVMAENKDVMDSFIAEAMKHQPEVASMLECKEVPFYDIKDFLNSKDFIYGIMYIKTNGDIDFVPKQSSLIKQFYKTKDELTADDLSKFAPMVDETVIELVREGLAANDVRYTCETFLDVSIPLFIEFHKAIKAGRLDHQRSCIQIQNVDNNQIETVYNYCDNANDIISIYSAYVSILQVALRSSIQDIKEEMAKIEERERENNANSPNPISDNNDELDIDADLGFVQKPEIIYNGENQSELTDKLITLKKVNWINKNCVSADPIGFIVVPVTYKDSWIAQRAGYMGWNIHIKD